MALVLARKINQSVLIEDDILLTVVDLDHDNHEVRFTLKRISGEDLVDNNPLVLRQDERLILLGVLRVRPVSIGRINTRLAFETMPGCAKLDVYRLELITGSQKEDAPSANLIPLTGETA